MRPKIEDQPWTITFTERDMQRLQVPHNDALVDTVQIGAHAVETLVDQGNSVKVMYYSLFKLLNILEAKLLPIEVSLVRFNESPVWPLSRVVLPVVVVSVMLRMEFIIVNCKRVEPLLG